MKTKSIYLVFHILTIIMVSIVITGCEKTPLSKDNQTDENNILKASVSNGMFYIINKNSGKALDLIINTGNIIQYTYYGNLNQKWQLINVGGGYYRISPLSNNTLSLDIASQSTENGANL